MAGVFEITTDQVGTVGVVAADEASAIHAVVGECLRSKLIGNVDIDISGSVLPKSLFYSITRVQPDTSQDKTLMILSADLGTSPAYERAVAQAVASGGTNSVIMVFELLGTASVVA